MTGSRAEHDARWLAGECTMCQRGGVLMATCHLCPGRPDDSEMWEHLRVMHPDQWGEGPERWPDGEPVIHDLTLKPTDFTEEKRR